MLLSLAHLHAPEPTVSALGVYYSLSAVGSLDSGAGGDHRKGTAGRDVKGMASDKGPHQLLDDLSDVVSAISNGVPLIPKIESHSPSSRKSDATRLFGSKGRYD